MRIRDWFSFTLGSSTGLAVGMQLNNGDIFFVMFTLLMTLCGCALVFLAYQIWKIFPEAFPLDDHPPQ